MKEINKERNEQIKILKQPNISEQTKKQRSKQTNKLKKQTGEQKK